MYNLSRGLAAVTVACCALSTLSQAPLRQFRVKDSIEMTTFSSPFQLSHTPEICFSPDGSKFLIVVSRGEIATNKIYSRLLMYDSDQVERYLRSGRVSSAPEPQQLAEVGAVPRAYAARSYAAVLTDLEWSADSKKLYFLGQQSDGTKHLYRVVVQNRKLEIISPVNFDVRQYAQGPLGSVVFKASSRNEDGASEESLSGLSLEGEARVVTGLPLQQVLFPSLDNGLRPRQYSLWLAPASGPAKRITTDHELGGADIDEVGLKVWSLSPDGRYILCLLPVESVPSAWSKYDPVPLFEFNRVRPADAVSDASKVSPFNINRIKVYYLVDVKTGRRRKLLDAPYAGSFGYHDASMALWEPDEHAVLLTNTFLPDSALAEPGNVRRPPCAAAWLDLRSERTQCIARSRYQYHGQVIGNAQPLALEGAHFEGHRGDQLTLHFGYNSQAVSVDEHYELQGDVWKPSTKQQADKPRTLSVYLQQDLTTPVTLWAKDAVSQTAKQLFDPNPQFNRFELPRVSVLHWADQTGRKWEGGLVYPVGYDPSKHYPLVIQTHGFEREQFLVDGPYPTAMAALPLASVGIAVLQMGYTYDHVLSAQEPADQLEGFRSAIDKLASEGIIDGSRVGIIGFSRPAWHVAAALENAPKLFTAATLADGADASYMQYMLLGPGDPGLVAQFEKINGGAPFGKGRESWLQHTVGFNFDRVQTPVRIEAIGPLSLLAEWESYASLNLQKKPVDMIYIPDDDHILQSPRNRLASQEGNVEWFCFWLLEGLERRACPITPPAQRENWSRMREQSGR